MNSRLKMKRTHSSINDLFMKTFKIIYSVCQKGFVKQGIMQFGVGYKRFEKKKPQ